MSVQAYVLREGLLCVGDEGPVLISWRSPAPTGTAAEVLARMLARPYAARQRALAPSASPYAIIKYGFYRGAPDSGPEVVGKYATAPELLAAMRQVLANDAGGGDEWSYDFVPAVWDGTGYEEPPP